MNFADILQFSKASGTHEMTCRHSKLLLEKLKLVKKKRVCTTIKWFYVVRRRAPGKLEVCNSQDTCVTLEVYVGYPV